MRVTLLLASALWAGCATPSPQTDSLAFHLDVSNQSFDQPDAHIWISIDNKTVVDQSFNVAHQHNWTRFDLPLGPGRHAFRADERSRGASLEESIDVATERWATLDYWTGPPRFSLTLHDQPPAYD